MLPVALILFRETLEISLILGVICAATRGLSGRGRWLWAGIAGGVFGSALVALFAGQLADALEGMGQEVFNATVLLLAAAMIGWTVVWMRAHAREMTRRMKEVGAGVRSGELPFYTLALVVSLSMWREGSEIVLFLYGTLGTTEAPLLAIVLGGLAGALGGAAIGTLIYFGLLRIPVKHVFSVTGWLLVLLACGMAAQAAGYLIAADYLPPLVEAVWDTSGLLPHSTMPGSILHSLVGYTDRPSGMQLLFFGVTFALLALLLRRAPSRPPAASPAGRAAA